MKHQTTLLLSLLASPLAVLASPLMACPAIRPPPKSHAEPPTTISSITTLPSTAVAPIATSSEVALPSTPAVITSTAPLFTSTAPLVTSTAPLVTPSTEVSAESPAPEPTTASTTLITEVSVPATTLITSVAPVSTSTSSAPAQTTTAVSKPAGSSDVSGESTFYGGNVAGGMCSFSTYTIPSGLYGTAFSGSAWDDAAHCGQCLEVTGPNGNSITVMVVDECPECDEGHLDLFEDAFEQLGDISAGIISTSYTAVPCGITSPIVLHNKSGTSAYWFSMQVVNANEPVSTLEVSTDGGSTWQATTRQPYNFFENSSGFGTSSVDVRVTSTNGKSIVVKDVSIASDSQVEASSNF